MDYIVQKIVALGIPGIVLLVAMVFFPRLFDHVLL